MMQRLLRYSIAVPNELAQHLVPTLFTNPVFGMFGMDAPFTQCFLRFEFDDRNSVVYS
jgi:hypothetical protein